MKPPLTPELKERFFAQYWGQEVFNYERNLINRPVWYTPEFVVETNGWAVLKPLSKITDEDAIEVAKCAMEILWVGTNKMYFSVTRERYTITVKEKYNVRYAVLDPVDGQVLTYDEHDLSGSGNHNWAYQKLISLGYALPYFGYTVQELVDFGWVKLIEKS